MCARPKYKVWRQNTQEMCRSRPAKLRDLSIILLSCVSACDMIMTLAVGERSKVTQLTTAT